MAKAFDYDSLPLVFVACPICGERRFEKLAVADRYKMGISTSGCCNCGLVMTNPRPMDKDISLFYQRHYRRFYQSVSRPNERYIVKYNKHVRAKYTSDWIKAALGDIPVAAILDIGAAEGSLLRVLGEAFPSASLAAVEPDTDFRLFALKYAPCSAWVSLADVPAGGNFDLVIANHVLEHSSEPVAFLRSIAARLRRGGRVYLDVPALERYSSVESLHIAHLFHFSESTLRRTVAAADLEILRIEAHSPPSHPPSIRALLATSTSNAERAVTHNEYANWQIIRMIGQRAWRYHLRYLRLSWLSRFKRSS